MKTFSNTLSLAREKAGLLSRELAAALGVDAALVSRFEKGNRMPTREQVVKLAGILGVPVRELLVPWMSEKVLKEIGHDAMALEALALAEEKVQFLQEQRPILKKSLQTQLNRIDKLKKQLDRYRANDNFRLAEALAIEYTYESNKIEGNTLSLNETALVINDGITVSGKTMREHLEAINHYDAIAFIRELAGKNAGISERQLLQLHHLVLRGIDRENAGVYRKVPVRISGSSHIPPEPYMVPKKMEDLFEWYEQNRTLLHPVVLAAEMHERLVSIHPFIDGNGRTSRLLMNLILLQNGYVIANLKGEKSSRLHYYECLEAARTDAGKTAFVALIAETELKGISDYVSWLKP